MLVQSNSDGNTWKGLQMSFPGILGAFHEWTFIQQGTYLFNNMNGVLGKY